MKMKKKKKGIHKICWYVEESTYFTEIQEKYNQDFKNSHILFTKSVLMTNKTERKSFNLKNVEMCDVNNRNNK